MWPNRNWRNWVSPTKISWPRSPSRTWWLPVVPLRCRVADSASRQPGKLGSPEEIGELVMRRSLGDMVGTIGAELSPYSRNLSDSRPMGTSASGSLATTATERFGSRTWPRAASSPRAADGGDALSGGTGIGDPGGQCGGETCWIAPLSSTSGSRRSWPIFRPVSMSRSYLAVRPS